MTPDYIAYHAQTRPDAVALIHDDRPITYADFHQDIRKFTRAVQELGLSGVGSVAVKCEEFYAHWLLLLAFERLGIATASVPAQEASSTFFQTDLLLSDTDAESAGSAERCQSIGGAWLERVFGLDALDIEPALQRKPDDVIRILRTSGTTGAAKRMLLRRSMHEARLANWMCFGIKPEHRFLVSTRFTMHALYSMATACLRRGATVVNDNRRSLGEALIAHDIDHVILMPQQLRHVLDQLPGDGSRPRHLAICSLGATLPAALRARALSRIATEVLDLYACNEVALVAVTRAGAGYGALWPGATVEVVDEQGGLLPPGQAGAIRVATDSMVEGYLDDPETTGRMFRGGWFYPGDIGVLHGVRQLQVLGRADELLNVSGVKISPSDLEEHIMSETGIDDVGVCTIADPEGVEQLCIAVSGASAEHQPALERIRQLRGELRMGNVFVVDVTPIPRTASGKIQRALLKTAVLAKVRLAGLI